jgi:hypothetical protein
VGLAVGAASSSEDGVAARELPDLLVEGLLLVASQREQPSVAPEKLPAPSAIQISYIFNLQQQQQYMCLDKQLLVRKPHLFVCVVCCRRAFACFVCGVLFVY